MGSSSRSRWLPKSSEEGLNGFEIVVHLLAKRWTSVACLFLGDDDVFNRVQLRQQDKRWASVDKAGTRHGVADRSEAQPFVRDSNCRAQCLNRYGEYRRVRDQGRALHRGDLGIGLPSELSTKQQPDCHSSRRFGDHPVCCICYRRPVSGRKNDSRPVSSRCPCVDARRKRKSSEPSARRAAVFQLHRRNEVMTSHGQ